MWVDPPSSCWLFTTSSMPVSRRWSRRGCAFAALHARRSAPARAWRPLRLPVSGTHGCVRRASERSVYAARADQSGIPAYPGRTGRNTPRHRLLSTGRCSDGPPPPGEPPGGAQAPASPAPDPETKRCNTAIDRRDKSTLAAAPPRPCCPCLHALSMVPSGPVSPPVVRSEFLSLPIPGTHG